MMGFNRADRSSQVVTFEGKVEFGVPGPGGSIAGAVFVTPGMTAAVNVGGAAPTQPAPMPKEDFAKMEKESAAEPPKAQSPNAPANDQRAPAAEEGRAPSAANGPEMQGPKEDLAPPPIVKPPVAPPKPPEVPRFGEDQRVRDTIKGGNTNLIIRVK